MRGHCRILASIFLIGSSAASGQYVQPICADRPGKATATCTVPAGHLQLEVGFVDLVEEEGKKERETQLALAETRAKYGLTDRSDIEIDIRPWLRASSHSHGSRQHSEGFGDVSLIYKRQVSAPGDTFKVDIMPFVKIPSASGSLGNGRVEGGVLVPLGRSLGHSDFAIALTPELDVAADGDRNGYHLEAAQVVSLGWQPSDRLSLSAEMWGALDWDPKGTSRQYSADAAIAYLVGKDLQLDAGANFGLNRASPDAEVYSGLSLLF